jgi:uncharacterized protein YabN with tetrapyrrole methylase and pyrophosphatase domain
MLFITKMSQEHTENNKTTRGSLIIVGVGIQAVRHATLETLQEIENSDKVLYMVYDPVTELWIKKLRPDAESLSSYYEEGKDRKQTYSEIVEHTLKYVRQGLRTCLVQYGHPGVFTRGVSQPAIRTARNEGFRAHMLPGISAEDCLFAELCVDPGDGGCQSFEATRFLLHKSKFDTFCHLVLWQIGVIGDYAFHLSRDPKSGLAVLTDYLEQYYDSNHEVFVYQAAQYSICKPLIQRIPLHRLPEAYADSTATLYVPPIVSGKGTRDKKMAQRLGLATKV